MTAPTINSGISTTPLFAGTAQLANPGGVAAGDKLFVVIKSANTNLVIDAWDSAGSPVTLTFTQFGTNYDPANGMQCFAGWERTFTGSETWPLNLSNTGGGSADYFCLITRGQKSGAATEGWVGYTKANNTNPIVGTGITATDADSILVHSFITDGNSSYDSGTGSTPATTIRENGTTAGGWSTSLTRVLTSAGASGSTSMPTVAADSANGVSFVIRPAAAAAASRRKLINALMAA